MPVVIRLRNPQDLAAGLFLVAIAVLAYVFAMDLPMGRAVRMGPGYLPRVLSYVLGGLGLIIAARGFAIDGPRLESWYWRPLITLTLALLVFAGLLERVGLVLATIVAVGFCSVAAPGARPLPVLILGVVLAAGCAALFKYLLGLPLMLMPWLGL